MKARVTNIKVGPLNLVHIFTQKYIQKHKVYEPKHNM